MVVSFLFTLGFLSCFAGIIRTYYMWRVTQVWDQVWHSYPVWVSAAVELYIGIVRYLPVRVFICIDLQLTNPQDLRIHPRNQGLFPKLLPQDILPLRPWSALLNRRIRPSRHEAKR